MNEYALANTTTYLSPQSKNQRNINHYAVAFLIVLNWMGIGTKIETGVADGQTHAHTHATKHARDERCIMQDTSTMYKHTQI